MFYGADTFLRLPLYLQEAGRGVEAWAEFERLLTAGLPKQLPDADLVPMYQSEIYGKMRLFLQREGKSDQAVVYGMLSSLAWAKGLSMQKRTQEYRDATTPDAMASALRPLLKKAGLSAHAAKFEDVMQDEARAGARIDLESAARRANALLGEAGRA
jgi:hypothetical protein